MSIQLLFKVQDLRHYIVSIKTQEFVNIDSDIVGMVDSIISTLGKISTKKKLSKSQKQFLLLLSSLKDSLTVTNLVIDSAVSVNFWDWLLQKHKRRTPQSIVFEDYPELSSVEKVVKLCESLEERLRIAAGRVSCKDKITRFFFEDFLGNTDFMREDLMSRFKCESFLVGGKTDWYFSFSLLVTVNPQGPTMIYCNPNAGFYEFSFHRSEWFEFYHDLGINLVLWNYPGYGRSAGTSSLKKILNDGQEIFQFLRNHKAVQVIGIHGESLGGSIAAQLAARCSADFLFADRTFASLCKTARYNFGKIAYFSFRGSCQEDIDSVKNYLDVKCYKVISSDFRDCMINDLASLKVGVAQELLFPDTKSFPETYIMTKDASINLLKSLTRISTLVRSLNSLTSSKSSTNYKPLQEDLELFENERFKEVIQKLKNLLLLVEAGGCSLLDVVRSKNPFKALTAWILVFDVWGCSVFLTKSSSVQNTINVLNNVMNELENLNDVEQVRNEVARIQEAVFTLKRHFETRIEAIDSKSLFTSQELKQEIDYENAGHLISLSCGHAGPFGNFERLSYQRHLSKSKFINLIS
jgi:hypothetical protein